MTCELFVGGREVEIITRAFGKFTLSFGQRDKYVISKMVQTICMFITDTDDTT